MEATIDHTYHDHRCADLPCAVCCCRIHGSCPDCPKHGAKVQAARASR